MVTEIATNGHREFAASQPKRGAFLEVGGTGLRRFSGYVLEDFDPMLTGRRAVHIYDEMRRNDPSVAALLTAIEFIIRHVDWVTVPGGKTQADLDAAEFLHQCMNDMDASMQDWLSEICTMFPFGWAWFETVFKQRNGLNPPGSEAPSLYDDGRVGWHKFGLRGQESLRRWEFEDQGGGLAAMIQQLPTGGPEIRIPTEKSILFRVRREKNNPEGWSILRSAYRPWYLKKVLEEIEVQGAERDLVGMLKIKLPPNADESDRAVARKMLEDYHTGDQVGLMVPTVANSPEEAQAGLDWDVDLIKSPGSKVVDTDKLVRRYTTEITRSSLAQFLTLGDGRVGSFALAKTHEDLFQMCCNGHLDNIADTMNRFAVRPLFALNEFSNLSALPQIKHTDLGEIEAKDFFTAYSELKKAGLPLDDPEAINILRNKMGLPELDEEFFKKQEEEKQQMLEIAKKAATQPPQPPQQPGGSAQGAKPQQGQKPEEAKKPMTAREWAEWLMGED